MRFFKKNLFDPFAKAIRDYNITKQKMTEEYKALKKSSKDVKLNKKIPGTIFKVDHAIRAYLWETKGIEIPGLDKVQIKQLVDYVSNNPKLVNYANTLSSISRVNEG